MSSLYYYKDYKIRNKGESIEDPVGKTDRPALGRGLMGSVPLKIASNSLRA
jgi:hypothetical protein